VVTITADWQKVNITVPVYALRSDVTLWRKMNFDDWDTVTQRLREDGLSAMRNRFGHLISNPQQWDRMDAHDWDLIPQPIRAMTDMQMIRYWSGYYQVGASLGLPLGTVTNTMSAIVMAESWFEHRARHVNADGHRDIGLGGFSEHCRRTLERLAGEGAVDFNMRGEDYFDPWHATRVVAVWFERMLQEANGDLDLAVRAYHRGRLLARRGEGTAYLANVKRLRQRFIRNEESTPPGIFCSFERPAKRVPVRPAGLRATPSTAAGGRRWTSERTRT